MPQQKNTETNYVNYKAAYLQHFPLVFSSINLNKVSDNKYDVTEESVVVGGKNACSGNGLQYLTAKMREKMDLFESRDHHLLLFE